MNRSSASAAVAAFAMICLAVFALSAKNYDFRAFYCAGSAARAAADPYKLQPLYDCERYRTYNDPSWTTKEAVPAPFPGYVITAVFEPLAGLPYATAARIWTLLLLAALTCSALLLRRCAGTSFALAIASVSLSGGLASLGFGETVPLFLLCAALAMYEMHRGRWHTAACAAGATLLEPHLGLPICAALFIWAPKTRGILAGVALLLAAIWAATLGASSIAEYFARVLPFQALADISSDRQLALSAVLHAAGMNDAWALRLGTLSYAIASAGGIAAAGAIARARGNAAYLVAVPAAAALFGGVYLHASQVLAAVPLALLFAAKPASRASVALLCGLAVPWMWIVNPVLGVMALLSVAGIAWEGSGGDARFAAACTGSAGVLLLAFFFAISPHGATGAGYVPAAIDPAYPQADWARETARFISTGSPLAWWRRIPTWGALAIVLGICAAAVPRRERKEAV